MKQTLKFDEWISECRTLFRETGLTDAQIEEEIMDIGIYFDDGESPESTVAEVMEIIKAEANIEKE